MLRAIKYITVAAAVSLPMITQFEGYEPHPYYDSVGILTVGYGETEGVEDRFYSHAEALEMLAVRVQTGYVEPIEKCSATWDEMPLSTKAAAASLAYNIGVGAYCRSTIRKLFDARKYLEGCEFFKRYKYAGGKVLRGLEIRRGKEAEFCKSGLNT